MLDKKLVRDLGRLKGQVATIALVLACGIMAMLMLRSTWQSLLGARDTYYAEYGFADVFAHLERAPDGVAARLEAIPGVARVYPRIVEDVMVPIADDPDPITGRIVSLPDDGEEPPLNALYLRSGRLPAAGATDEIAILEQFATAHHLEPGDTLPVLLNGRLRQLRVVGVALSPEYVLAMAGGGMPDPGRFVVIWMPRAAVAPAFQMDGAFDDVALQLEPGADVLAVKEAVDRELARWGGLSSVGRDKQLSNYALNGEFEQLRTLAVIIPLMFLGVAAFLVNVVVSRLVFLERTQIAVLKALGFSDARIARHYLGLVVLIVAVASVLGVWLGIVSGRWMSGMYADFYRFPSNEHHVSPVLIALTCGIGLAAATIGALGAVRRVARMAPAEAMRPPAPLAYRRSLVERAGLARAIGPSAMMVVREIQRRPVRFLFSVAGIAMGVAIFVMGRFSWDSFEHVFEEQFVRQFRQDLTVALDHPRPARAVRELAHVPGVTDAEGQRAVPVRFHAGTRKHDSVLISVADPPALHQLLDHGVVPVMPPEGGLLMTDQLAKDLDVRAGDALDVELLEGDRSSRRVVVGGVIDEAFGLQAYVRERELWAILREEPRVSSILVRVDADRAEDVRARLKAIPAVVGVTSVGRAMQNYRDQTGQTILVMTLILTLSAAAIAVGVVYNNARIALSMRSRDLASLRVLGFTRREISSVLLGELGAQVALGVPLGLWFGRRLAGVFAASIDPEYMRFPVFISSRTYAAGATIAVVAGLLSALLVRRKLDQLDLVGVLKSASE